MGIIFRVGEEENLEYATHEKPDAEMCSGSKEAEGKENVEIHALNTSQSSRIRRTSGMPAASGCKIKKS